MVRAQLPATLICGTVRNGGTSFVKTLKVIETLKPLFERTAIVIVTNDNTDDTDAVLAAWSASQASHHLIRLTGFAASWPDRIDRLAVARNYYLEFMRSRLAGQFENVLVLDLDGPNQALDPAQFHRAITSVTSDWDGLFANQTRAYYDLYPLRHDRWCPNDCLEEVRQSWNKKAACKKFIYARQIQIPPSHPPFRVRSAFGGMALYRAKALHNCWYGSRRANGVKVCDHVVVNEEIDRRGGKLLIVPALLNEAPAEHLGPASGRPLPPTLVL